MSVPVTVGNFLRPFRHPLVHTSLLHVRLMLGAQSNILLMKLPVSILLAIHGVFYCFAHYLMHLQILLSSFTIAKASFSLKTCHIIDCDKPVPFFQFMKALTTTTCERQKKNFAGSLNCTTVSFLSLIHI